MRLRTLLLFTLSPLLLCHAATLRWEDTTNGPGTSYIISNRVGVSWQWLASTTNKSLAVVLVPGTNWFSLTASNGLLGDAVLTSSNFPARVLNVIIESSAKPDGGWQVDTNLSQFVATIGPAKFFRSRVELLP